MLKTTVGYTGGSTPNPTYKTVKAGDGHTEAIQVQYDTSKVSYEDLLDMFFRDSTGESSGRVQYKAAIWVESQAQRELAEKKAKKEGKEGRLDILEVQEWTDAEDYHQKYYEKKRSAAPGSAMKGLAKAKQTKPAKPVPTSGPGATATKTSAAAPWSRAMNWLSRATCRTATPQRAPDRL